ncbi:hypothetical protein CWO90_37175 [Bradyrhizobium sp. Leo121]|nr:hypothetical protein CWO90_37175 [Bradyrhizobium sp. Leo121]
MIADRFDSRTFAHMQVALERACQALPQGSNNHEARGHIASRIIECAEGGDRTLSGLTEVGRRAALELPPHQAA